MGRNELQMKPPRLTRDERSRIFDKVAKTVTTQYYDPKFNGTDWPNRALAERDRIIALADPEEFEQGVHDLLRVLGSSHTGFFHQSVRRIPSRLAIAVTFHKAETAAGPTWSVQDVHESGPAHGTGLLPHDQLISIAGKPVTSADQLTFAMGTTVDLVVRRDSREVPIRIEVAAPKSRKQPHAQMKAVSVAKLAGNIGYLKIPVLPGMLGLDVAREMDSAMGELAECEGLVLDLRGHIGGGLGVLRLMSHLIAGKVPIGYTVTRKRAEKGFDKEELPKLDRLPTHLPNPVAIASMALKFAGRDLSVALISEGLGEKRWHGRLAVLINEHTISAGEMVAAFVRDYRLGRLIGAKTPGRLVPAAGKNVGHGYMVVLPRAKYVPWTGPQVEGDGVSPDILAEWKHDADEQLARGLSSLTASKERSH